MFELSLREWIKFVEFHSSSPTRNRDVHLNLKIISFFYLDACMMKTEKLYWDNLELFLADKEGAQYKKLLIRSTDNKIRVSHN